MLIFSVDLIKLSKRSYQLQSLQTTFTAYLGSSTRLSFLQDPSSILEALRCGTMLRNSLKKSQIKLEENGSLTQATVPSMVLRQILRSRIVLEDNISLELFSWTLIFHKDLIFNIKLVKTLKRKKKETTKTNKNYVKMIKNVVMKIRSKKSSLKKSYIHNQKS